MYKCQQLKKKNTKEKELWKFFVKINNNNNDKKVVWFWTGSANA